MKFLYAGVENLHFGLLKNNNSKVTKTNFQNSSNTYLSMEKLFIGQLQK